MFGKIMCHVVSIFMVVSLVGAVVQVGEASSYKVLVVMSYESDYPWNQEVQEGIDSVLAETCEIKYVYMQTKKDLQGGPAKAKEAYKIYQEFQPDGVIATDDNAQTMFVIPYLKDKVETPVMFCGVNSEPEKYGYPASNVSGILERANFRESFAFAQQLVPSIKTSCFMVKKSPTAEGFAEQVEREGETYTAVPVAFKMPATVDEALSMAEELKKDCDVMFLESLQGIPDKEGTPRSDKEVIPLIAEGFGKPTVGGNQYLLEFGTLCAVVKRGQEQGEVAAQKLLQAMQGTPLSQIPITQNKRGKRMINVDVMRALGIKPKPHILQGVELVKTED